MCLYASTLLLMKDISDNKLLGLGEVADLLRLSKQTVRRWIRTGKLPAVKLGYNTFRIERDQIDRLIVQRRTSPVK